MEATRIVGARADQLKGATAHADLAEALEPLLSAITRVPTARREELQDALREWGCDLLSPEKRQRLLSLLAPDEVAIAGGAQ